MRTDAAFPTRARSAVRRRLRHATAPVVLLLLGACSGGMAAAPPGPPSPPPTAGSSAPLTPGDAIRLAFSREPGLNGDYPIDETGTASLPLLGQRNVTDRPRQRCEGGIDAGIRRAHAEPGRAGGLPAPRPRPGRGPESRALPRRSDNDVRRRPRHGRRRVERWRPEEREPGARRRRSWRTGWTPGGPSAWTCSPATRSTCRRRAGSRATARCWRARALGRWARSSRGGFGSLDRRGTREHAVRGGHGECDRYNEKSCGESTPPRLHIGSSQTPP